jgi:hypothetical protein
MTTIYMQLVDEAVEVWRPVEATVMSDNIFRVEGPVPADEEWEFPPGSIVRCKLMTYADGGPWLTAVAVAE